MEFDISIPVLVPGWIFKVMSINNSLAIIMNGMNTIQKRQTVTNQNLANMDVAGYSRKELPVSTLTYGGRGTENRAAGVKAGEVTRASDPGLHRQISLMSAEQGYAEAIEQYAKQAGGLNSSADGLSALPDALTELSSSVAALADHPASAAHAQAVAGSAAELAGRIRGMDRDYQNLAVDAVRQRAGVTEQMNDDLRELETVNRSLRGIADVDLEDRRDALVLSISAKSGASVTRTRTGEATFFGSDGKQLTAPIGDEAASRITGGTIGGLSNVASALVPAWRADLDKLSAQLERSVNASGITFFSGDRAGTIEASPELAEKLMSSGTSVQSGQQLDGPGSGASPQPDGDENHQSPIRSAYEALRSNANLAAEVGSAPASVANQASHNLDNTRMRLGNAEVRMKERTGVDLATEAADLLAQRRAYEALGKAASVNEDMWDTLMQILK